MLALPPFRYRTPKSDRLLGSPGPGYDAVYKPRRLLESTEAVEMRGRYMDVAKNIDGSWLYIADHASMPLPAEE